MAYGDSVAAMIGKRYGKYYIGDKSIEGSFGMFVASLISLLLGMVYFSSFYEFTILVQFIPILAVSFVVTIAELMSPHGSDNITVPLLGVLTFVIVNGGI
jgi:dolichol kinase